MGERVTAGELVAELVDVIQDLIFEHRIRGYEDPPDDDQTGVIGRLKDRLGRAHHFVNMAGHVDPADVAPTSVGDTP